MKYKVVYGEDSISILYKGKEILYWVQDEWIEDPQLLFSIGYAIELAYQDRLIQEIKNKLK
jgi:hypothetical protein